MMAAASHPVRLLLNKCSRPLLEKSLPVLCSRDNIAGNRTISVSTTDRRPPYGYSSNVNVERLRNKDKQFFTPGPLDPEILDFKDYKIDEKQLFALGPLKVTQTIKESMMLDVGSRDPQFLKTIQFIRSKLLEIGGVHADDYSTILLSANGPCSMESVLQTMIPRNKGKVLVLQNGADGRLLSEICHRASYDTHVLTFPEDCPVDVEQVRTLLERDDTFTNVVMVHCEPSSGLINPVEEVGRLVHFYSPRARFIVDGALSFGAVPLDLEEGRIHCLVANSYGCLESVPGVCFVLARNQVLEQCTDNCRSLTMDLVRHWKKQVRTGAMSYVPNTHSVLALARAIVEFEEEGGVEGRARRYKKNNKVLREGMMKLGFTEYLPDHGGFMVTGFHFPQHHNFHFDTFAEKLYDRGIVVYQGRGGKGNCFRVCNIGQINPHDVRYLIRQVEDSCSVMNIDLPLD